MTRSTLMKGLLLGSAAVLATASAQASDFNVPGGDLNALTAVEWHPDQVQVLPVTGSNLARMMQVAVIPAPGVKVTPHKHGGHHAGLHTDHPFRWATFELEAS